jgi:hypothetical protein
MGASAHRRAYVETARMTLRIRREVVTGDMRVAGAGVAGV